MVELVDRTVHAASSSPRPRCSSHLPALRHAVRSLALRIAVVALSLSLLGCTAAEWNALAIAMGGAASGNAYAPGTSSRVQVCAKYQTSSGWSRGYRVTVDVVSGGELNRRTSSYSYNAYSTYVVIFWDSNEASVIRLDSYFGSISTVGQYGTDRGGRRWSVARTSVCF